MLSGTSGYPLQHQRRTTMSLQVWQLLRDARTIKGYQLRMVFLLMQVRQYLLKSTALASYM